jgi:hypothetical protein
MAAAVPAIRVFGLAGLGRRGCRRSARACQVKRNGRRHGSAARGSRGCGFFENRSPRAGCASALFLRHLEGRFQGFRLVGEFRADGGERVVRARIRTAARDLVAAHRKISKIGGNTDLHYSPQDGDVAARPACIGPPVRAGPPQVPSATVMQNLRRNSKAKFQTGRQGRLPATVVAMPAPNRRPKPVAGTEAAAGAGKRR